MYLSGSPMFHKPATFVPSVIIATSCSPKVIGNHGANTFRPDTLQFSDLQTFGVYDVPDDLHAGLS